MVLTNFHIWQTSCLCGGSGLQLGGVSEVAEQMVGGSKLNL